MEKAGMHIIVQIQFSLEVMLNNFTYANEIL